MVDKENTKDILVIGTQDAEGGKIHVRVKEREGIQITSYFRFHKLIMGERGMVSFLSITQRVGTLGSSGKNVKIILSMEKKT